MKSKLILTLMLALLILPSAVTAQAPRQEAAVQEASAGAGNQTQPVSERLVSQVQFSVPRLIRFSGTLPAPSGPSEGRVVGMTFALYQEAEGGAPVWQEVQNVTLDAHGRYGVLLGSTSTEGLPMDIFAGGEAHWLGVQVEGGKEQPRILLVSVPYALKAADAETLGGKPLSSFVLQEEGTTGPVSQQEKGKRSGAASVTDPGSTPQVTAGTAGRIAKFTNATDLGDSVMFESAGKIGVGTITPASLLHLSATSPELRLSSTSSNSIPQLSFYDGATLGGVFQYRNSGVADPNIFRLGGIASGSQFAVVTSGTEKVRVNAAGNVGIGTTAPASLLNLNGVSPELRVTSTSATAIPQLTFYEGGTIGGFFQYRNSGAADPNLFSLGAKPAGSQFTIFTEGLEKVRVTAAGNVGIGTKTPGQKLTVAGMVESTSGGFKFPNGSVQTVAMVDTNSGGTVTSVAAGTGLTATPSPIVGSGTLSIDTTVVPRLNAANIFTGANTFTQDQSVARLFVNSSANAVVHFGTTTVLADQPFQPDGGLTGVFLEGREGTSEGGGFFANGNVAVIWSPGDVDLLRVFDEDNFAAGARFKINGNGGIVNNIINAGGNLILGQENGANRWRVDNTGRGFFNNGTQTGGADFAESFQVEGERDHYEPGDVMAIDPTGARRLSLAREPYSSRVAGIYSTKPGVLATPYEMDDPRIATEIPLAIVGVVPCKVTAENGPIAPGDLLVTSSTPGHAMKGTDRLRMTGTVVGKALGSLSTGTGVIEVLVSLQ